MACASGSRQLCADSLDQADEADEADKGERVGGDYHVELKNIKDDSQQVPHATLNQRRRRGERPVVGPVRRHARRQTLRHRDFRARTPRAPR